MPEAARTLVKSPPELWAEVSDPESLSRHLGAFGEIRITRLDPESTVAWEGDRVSGTVDLAPAGWGTRVTVKAEVAEPPAEPETPQAAEIPAEPEPEPEPEPAPEREPDSDPQPAGGVRGFFQRLFGRRPTATEPEPEPQAEAEAATDAPEDPTPPAPTPPDPISESVLEDALGSLGAAHHRPFSR